MLFGKNVLMHAVEAATAAGGSAIPTVVNIPAEGKEVNFHFKKEKVKNAEGAVIGEGKKLPSLKKVVPVPTPEGILKIVETGGKELEYLQELMRDAVADQVRVQINKIREKTPDAEIKPEQIDDAQLSWSIIANLPRGERRGLGISEDDWNDFAADYRAIMPGVTGKDKERIEKHIQLFLKKYQPCRNDKKALKVLKDALTMWAANTSAMEDNQTVYEYLNERADTLLAEEEKVLAEAL